jgi:putative ABC transport system ATP-binding protein
MSNAAPSDQLTLFALLGICRTYGEGETAVRALIDVDLDICGGELIVLLGPSGSGKSTLLNILGGLDRPSAGAIQFRGAPLTGLSEQALTHYRRKHVGFIFQFYNLIPSLTARENVELVGEITDDPWRRRSA